jgi:hypothetical protein
MEEVNHLSGEGKSVKTMKILRSLALVWVCAASAATNEVVSVGEVKVDPRARTVSFPAQVNQRSGAIEYLLVHETGKVHESLFRTSVPPQQIHLGALLLSEKSTNSPALPAPTVSISWKDKTVSAEELILDLKNKRPLGKTKWAYRGSRIVDGTFLAQRDGSIVAVMEDRDALIDQNTPEASDDKNWEPVTEAMPPVGEKVMIKIRFEKPKD